MLQNNILIGPYIGSFTYEILVFQPYVNYLLSVLEYDNVFIASHYNRELLYSDIPNMTFIPIYSQLTRSELNQKGLINTEITKQQYNQITKMIKTSVDDISDHYTTPYIKSTNTISYYQKEYRKYAYPSIDLEVDDDLIVFIPDTSEESKDLYDNIKDLYNVVIIGDMNNGIAIDNILLQKYNYYDIVYEYMFNYIHKARMIITSCPEWAMICNIQGLNVLYWGDDCSMYKNNGIYNFDNYNVTAIKDISVSMINYVFNKKKV